MEGLEWYKNMISWLFEIDTLKLSTKDVTWSAVDYSGIVIPDSFSGITMRWNIAGNGLIAPNEMTFDVSNPGGTYLTTDFEDKFCTVRLIDGDTNVRTWKFKINRAISYYGKITCYCVDFLQEFLVGDYPNTKAPKEIWPSSDAENSDDYCVPLTLGTAYIPVRSVNTATDRFYVLGESGPTYSVYEVASPRAWPNSSTWSSTSYTMTGSTNSGYQLLQPIIADSDGDDIADAPGLWRSGDTFYDMLCRFERSDTVSLNNPAEWTEYVLEDFGVASADIDDVSFAAAGANYDALTLGFDGGGWWKKESRERILSNLLAQTDSFLVQTDKVELYQFDKTPKETITDTLRLSFSPSSVTKSINDAGRVHWQESASKPSDVLNGRAVVPTHGGVGATENTPSSEILECRFLSDSISAQKAGILYFQKKFEQSQRINFSVTFSSLTNKATLTPGYVVTVDNTLYGGSNNVVITDMVINPDMRVDFTGVVLKYLEDWGDLTTTTKDVVTDSSSGFQLATTDYNGTLEAGTDWDTNLLNIPDRFKDTASLGINVTDSYMGYYDGSAFQVFIQNNGNVQFGDPTVGQGFTWNQDAGVCVIRGSFTVQNPVDVRSALNVADGATNGMTTAEALRLSALQAQTDNKISVYVQEATPSWTDDNADHKGDQWYKPSELKWYEYNGTTWAVNDDSIYDINSLAAGKTTYHYASGTSSPSTALGVVGDFCTYKNTSTGVVKLYKKTGSSTWTEQAGSFTDGATNGADWNTNVLHIPQRFRDTASLGLNVTGSYLGYYDGSAFQSYIGGDGKFQFRGNASNYINWNGSTLNVVGSITVTNPSTVRSDLNVADGATRNTGALADLNSVSNDYITSIDGGKITTGIVNANRIYISSSRISDVGANADNTTTSINGGVITSGRIELQNSSNTTGAGVVGGGSSSSDIRFFAGNTYANRASAPFRVTHAGALVATSATISGIVATTAGSTINGISASTVLSNASAGATAATTVNSWKYLNTTYIDGGNIYTDTIVAHHILANEITANKINSTAGINGTRIGLSGGGVISVVYEEYDFGEWLGSGYYFAHTIHHGLGRHCIVQAFFKQPYTYRGETLYYYTEASAYQDGTAIIFNDNGNNYVELVYSYL